ncbi:hypothetical protein C6W19_17480 [Bacillus sp. RJGP41]|nr:hypothetical protein DOZ91_01160 [Peribacillus frigoritolerans]KOR87045.1 hypothetical protein AM233_25690 [Bacillus sp. FJAT-22058]PCD08869.1 hypothetical protein CMV16_00085 [Peribacillus simplex]PRS35639.1 hypothetical protein C6W19_17480 [Bacillus sp. RJGP41]
MKKGCIKWFNLWIFRQKHVNITSENVLSFKILLFNNQSYLLYILYISYIWGKLEERNLGMDKTE